MNTSRLPPLPHWCEEGSPFAQQMQAYALAAIQAQAQQPIDKVVFCTYPKCQTTGMKCAGQCSQASMAQQEPVGVVDLMPGTSGFTMACFHADKVPVGSKLYTHPAPQQKPLDLSRLQPFVHGLGKAILAEIMEEAAHNIGEKK